MTTILIGGRGYPVDPREAGFIAEWLEGQYAGDGSDEAEAAAGLELADALRAGAGPVEASDLQIEALATVMRDYLVHGNARLTALHQAVRRFRGDPESRSLP